MASYLELFYGVALLLTAFYYYRVYKFRFWRKRGVVGPKPHPIFGNLFDLTLARVTTADVVEDIRKKYKHEPVVGVFEGLSPILVLHDPDIITNVLIKDFTSFEERSHAVHERTEPMSLNLFQLDATRWRQLRPKISPVFTSGKLRDMFGLAVECSKNLEANLNKLVATGEPIEVKQMFSRFTMDVIGSCAFGIDMSGEGEKESEFRRMGNRIFDSSIETTLRLKTRLFWPELYDLLGYVVPEKTLVTFFTKTVMDMIKYRKEHSIYRPDFLNALIEFRNHPEWFKGIELTDTLLTAQAFVFFAAGSDTSSTAMSWALCELAQNHDVQDKLHEEMKAYHAKYGDTFTVESLKELKYLDKVFKETLRKFPAGALLQRRTTSEYTFDTLKFTIPKLINIWIPVFAIHRDPEIYPDPEKFDPERFNKEEVRTRHPMHYIPFGDGPRNCVGSRFAELQVKLGLVKVLRNHKVDVCKQTPIPYEYDASAFTLQSKNPIYLKITKI
ncbi:putative cytochrome P450 6a14 [Halictus rubicundus]|uniref:putative cytochrome P450 6a14 n=1 Tax=Halictus rubicundus TaxID=77578 RepID=UPI00403545DC